jgi:hypothetical protein
MRGRRLSPHMFPRIEDASGGAVYNMTHVSKKYVDEHGMVRYMFMEAEEKSFEELKQGLESGSLGLSDENGVLAFERTPPRGPLFAEDGSAPEKPKKKRKKKKKRLTIIKGTTKKASDHTKIIVSEEDAKKMAESEKTGGAKKKGNVIIISDSRIAGKQGMLIQPQKKMYASK